MQELLKELLEASQANKRGITFHVGGQPVSGIVVKIIGTEAVELRSNQYNRAMVRLDRVDAVVLS